MSSGVSAASGTASKRAQAPGQSQARTRRRASAVDSAAVDHCGWRQVRVDAEAIAVADEAADRPLHPPGRQRPAGEADRTLKRGFGDGEIRPERVHQLVLRHDPPGVADEVGEEVEDPRLQLLRLAAQREAAGFLVELEGAEGRGQGRHRAAGAANDKRKIGRR